jgi:hypothetical protein
VVGRLEGKLRQLMLKHELIRRLAGICASFHPTEHHAFRCYAIDEKQPLFSVRHVCDGTSQPACTRNHVPRYLRTLLSALPRGH